MPERRMCFIGFRSGAGKNSDRRLIPNLVLLCVFGCVCTCVFVKAHVCVNLKDSCSIIFSFKHAFVFLIRTGSSQPIQLFFLSFVPLSAAVISPACR